MSNTAASSASPSGDITRDAFKLPVANHVAINIGSFNYGISQTMLQGKTWSNKHVANFKAINRMLFEHGELDLCFGCECGGHKTGFWAAHIDVAILLKPNICDHADTLTTYLAMYKETVTDINRDAKQITLR